MKDEVAGDQPDQTSASNQPESQRRRDFLKGMAFGGLAGVVAATGIPKVIDDFTQGEQGRQVSEQIDPREFSILNKILDTFVDKSVEPEFWKQWDQILTADQSKYLDIHHSVTGGNVSNNVHTYDYYADGIKTGQPNMQLLVIDPDGSTYPSRAVMISLQLGEHGSINESNKNSQIIPFSNQQLQEKFSQCFREPAEAAQVPWEVDGNGKSEKMIQEDAGGFKYREGVYPTGAMVFTVWYPNRHGQIPSIPRPSNPLPTPRAKPNL